VARNIEQSGGRLQNAPLTEDIFESFVGALSREITFEELKTFIVNIIETELNISEMIYMNDNYKEQLMQYFHQVKWGEPKYIEDVDLQRTVKEGCQEVKYFTIYVKNLQGEILGIGKGNSKTRADQNSALDALINLDVLGKNDDCSDYYGEISDDDISSDESENASIQDMENSEEYFEE
jgi:dsRNA-specific ribonuclease